MRLTSTELLTTVQNLRDQGKSNSEICRECGYTSAKSDGSERLHFTDFYTELLNAQGGILPQEDEEWEYTHDAIDEDDEESMELYNDLCEEYDQDAVDEFIDYWTVDDLSYFKDAYVGHYKSESDFAQEWTEEMNGEIPHYVVVDWAATYENHLSDDFVYQNGYVFRGTGDEN
jgi:hypothetical protein